MNVRKSLIGSVLGTSLALAMAFVLGSTGTTLAQEKGAETLMRLQSIRTVQDLQSLDKGDTVIMSCPKCKDSTATVVEKTFKTVKPEEFKIVTIHLCPSCETKVVTKGHGKQAKDVLVHTCKTCGSKEVSCCVIKKGTGATAGMTEKQ
jgi:hypothetical protein